MPQNPTTPSGSPDRFRSTHPDSPRNASSFENRPPVIRARYTDEAPVARRAVPTAPSRQADVTDFVPTPAGSPRKRSRGRTIGKVAIVGFAGALVATMALPAYAFSPGTESDGLFAASQADLLRQGDAQTVAVAGGVVQAAIARDGFTAEAAPPPPEPEPEPVVEPVVDTTDVAEARAETAESFNSYEGASASELAASAPSTSYSLSAVFNTALQYQGVPYVFGGADPSGFDCSGLVMYVFAQYGISMPHSAAGQAAMGTQIPVSEAQPGDLVIMPGHDGFYAGNGNILHAPYEGASVRVQPIWTSNYTIVRISG
ncbi:cell wall-associated NlpC family hydrolase [Rathayibacter sp. PhB93]|uniref:C40 family peptidase n=1 Tax=unclassified Rathayibacter TaxID=2609250 RepID=UPI000F9A8DCE|nr:MULTISPECIES: C40 family peptidase [unclassified Rathayibacter]ROQ16070.1 cell wall-associated NlpC family hydrolase [Rathayibacter sp. PhB93]TDQ16011.1 cell wall-associated NlpC family hydrolase [Rathayibacter sp. PhB1]